VFSFVIVHFHLIRCSNLFSARPNSERSKSARAEKDVHFGFAEVDAPTEAIVDVVEKISKARGVSMAQIATAWLMSRKTVAAPICGTTKVENLKDLAAACSLKLTEEEIKVSQQLELKGVEFYWIERIIFVKRPPWVKTKGLMVDMFGFGMLTRSFVLTHRRSKLHTNQEMSSVIGDRLFFSAQTTILL